jgi:hypothetical protein
MPEQTSEQNRESAAENQRDQSEAAQPGGTYEPRDSRTVTGQGGSGVGTPGGADQQEGRERWSGDRELSEGESNPAQGAGQQGVPSQGAFSAEEAAQGRELQQGQRQGNAGQEQGQPGQSQFGYGSGQEGQQNQQSASGAGQGSSGVGAVDPEALGFVDQQTEASLATAGVDPDGNHQGGGSGGQQQQSTPGVVDPEALGFLDQQTEASLATAGFGGSGQQGEGSQGSGGGAGQIRPHMEVIGADGVHLGTVDEIEGDRIKLIKADSGMGSHQGHHHFISRGLVAEVEGDRVRLSATAANAYAMEEER